MVINRETAMLLWSKSFGKTTKAKDFAGREIVKAAYDQRGSAYGWNVDHILPQSRGGKTTESNLICCHIQTNDEKADKFPCFTANDKKFEIIKVQNHYEINKVSSGDDKKQNSEDSVNFYDSTSGIRLYKKLKGIQNKPVFVGTVIIELHGMQSTALIDFITELFSDKSISFKRYSSDDLIRYDSEFVIKINDYHLSLKEDIADLLDRCVLLNTYLGKYFTATQQLNSYKIFYGVHSNKAEESNQAQKIDCYTSVNEFYNYRNYNLAINYLVKFNTDAEKKELESIGRDKCGYDVYEYDYIYTNLAENLAKATK